MKYTHRQYVQALYESLQDTKPTSHDKVIENFIAILKQNGDLTQYEQIISEYEVYDQEQRGVKQVEVVTASETKLNKPLLDELNAIVGQKTELKQKVDDNLIGGVVVRVDDTLIDGSIKKQLEDLNSSLQK